MTLLELDLLAVAGTDDRRPRLKLIVRLALAALPYRPGSRGPSIVRARLLTARGKKMAAGLHALLQAPVSS
jgi:hypothetical protein